MFDPIMYSLCKGSGGLPVIELSNPAALGEDFVLTAEEIAMFEAHRGKACIFKYKIKMGEDQIADVCALTNSFNTQMGCTWSYFEPLLNYTFMAGYEGEWYAMVMPAE